MKSAAYETIVWTDEIKIERSVDGNWIWCTFYMKEKREYLYEKIQDQRRIVQIENHRERWKLCPTTKTFNYFVKLQLDANNKYTGYCKVIEKRLADVKGIPFLGTKIEGNDWKYYGRRKMQT